MRNRMVGLAALGVLLAMVPAAATTMVVGTGGANWQSSYLVNQNGFPYWDSPSADGSQYNIGYFITGTGAFAGNPNSPAASLSYWGYSNGAADNNFYFNTNLPQVASIQIEVAGLAASNALGWYEVGNPSNRQIIFTGPDNSSTGPKTFTPTANFGFYILTGDGNYYFMQSALNQENNSSYSGHYGYPGGETYHQHFALFRQSPTIYWLGVEDRSLSAEKSWNSTADKKNIGDFNDMVIRLQEVPEPGTYALMGAGLVLLGMLGRRRRRSAD